MLAIAAAQGKHVSRAALAATLLVTVVIASNAPAAPRRADPPAGDRITSSGRPKTLDFAASVFPVMGDQGCGACFLQDSAGLFLTFARNVDGAPPRIWISSSRVVAAEVLVQDATLGIAVLCVNPAQLQGCRPVSLPYLGAGPSMVFEGDTVAAVGVRLGQEPGLSVGVVSRVQSHRIRATFPSWNGPAGSPVVNDGGQVIAVLTSRGGPSSPSEGVPIQAVLPLVTAAAESLKLHGYPKPQTLPPISLESCPTAALRDRVDRVSDRWNDYIFEIPGYRVSLLTPPVCAYLEQHARPDAPRWFLWGTLEKRYPPILAVHVQPYRSTSAPLGALTTIVKVFQGTAHAVGSVVGGITGRPSRPRPYFDLQLSSDGIGVEPLVRQCSGQLFEEGWFSEPKRGSKAVFYYYLPKAFDPSDGHAPRIELLIFDPSKPDTPARLGLETKTVQIVAADLDLMSGGSVPASSSPAASSAKATPASSLLGHDAPRESARFRVALVGGSVVQAVAVQASGVDQVRIVLVTGETLLLSASSVHSIVNEDGADWTRHVVKERGAVP